MDNVGEYNVLTNIFIREKKEAGQSVRRGNVTMDAETRERERDKQRQKQREGVID